ncbi:MAG: hypothetical protein GX203_00310 [Acholeplasmataceae bacterium]|nr:hypothetical protein [Acholeplasmataceae bacterium]HOA63400.1 hypothetical protein [Bacilli bacterium]HPT88834.1 hypothetical protein [Bacilli bacterium]HQA19240.1 hypothetical protein [Bacilli bacterium]HQD91802.1 hypothetical protein [Bacilli bacterium]
MQENKIERQIIFYVWIYAILVTLILLIFDSKYSIYFALGTCANLFAYTTTIKTADRAILLQKIGKNPKGMVVVTGISKMVLYAIILTYIGYTAQKNQRSILIDVGITAFGMLSVKIMILFKHLVIDKIKSKRDNKQPKEINHE